MVRSLRRSNLLDSELLLFQSKAVILLTLLVGNRHQRGGEQLGNRATTVYVRELNVIRNTVPAIEKFIYNLSSMVLEVLKYTFSLAVQILLLGLSGGSRGVVASSLRELEVAQTSSAGGEL